MPANLKGSYKSKNGMVTYGSGSAKPTYGYGGSNMKKRQVKKASKGLEALAAANPELTYKKKAMYGGSSMKYKK